MKIVSIFCILYLFISSAHAIGAEESKALWWENLTLDRISREETSLQNLRTNINKKPRKLPAGSYKRFMKSVNQLYFLRDEISKVNKTKANTVGESSWQNSIKKSTVRVEEVLSLALGLEADVKRLSKKE